MEQSKHPEEKILELGKKLVKELELNKSTDTLGKWMANYIAELMESIELTESSHEKEDLKKECCDLILKLWNQVQNIPIRRPLEDLKPVTEILRVIQEERLFIIEPHWLTANKSISENNWGDFVSVVKTNAENIFHLAIEYNLHKDVLEKDINWIEEQKEFLTDEQQTFLEYIDVLKKSNNSVINFNESESLTSGQRKEVLFGEIEKLIEEQRKVLEKIKQNSSST